MAQITKRGDCDGTFCATVDGVEHEFEAWFDREITGPYSDFGRSGSYVEASCTVVGAWSYDEAGEVLFAGNRAELAALIGEAEVRRWEDEKSEAETEAMQ